MRLVLAATIGAAMAATAAAASPRVELSVPRLPRPPELEEFLDMRPPGDLAPFLARVEGGFVQRDPIDGEPASQHTDVYLGYDDLKLYVVFVAFDDDPARIRANVARRESVFGDDIVEIQLDTFLDRRQAYTFVANPHGVQWDAIWTEGRQFDPSWDTVWQSSGKIVENGYVVVMAIPFKSIRFPPGDEQRWGFFLVRDIPRNNESSFYPRMTLRVEGRMQQAGVLRGIRGISPGRNIRVIPYATARSFRVLDPDADSGATFVEEDADTDAGVDAKLVFRDRFVLDLTANPDFSQVESDEAQVTVNQRFEVFFPERRPFFLENANAFATPINLLFTRRILDPRAGVRLTGKLGPWSIGVLGVDDDGPGKLVGPDDPRRGERAWLSVVRVNRDVGEQSTVGFMATDRDWGPTGNRVLSADARLKLSENWVLSAQAADSRTRQVDGSWLADSAFDVFVNRSGRDWSTHAHLFQIGRDFRSEPGFVRRADIREYHHNVTYTFWPEGPRLLSWTPGLFVVRSWDRSGTRLDETIQGSLFWSFRRQTGIGLLADRGGERIRPEDFPSLDPATGLPVLTESVDFDTESYELSFESRWTRSLSVEAAYALGTTINVVPPAGDPPESADIRSVTLGANARATERLRFEGTYLMTRLSSAAGGGRIFVNDVARLRAAYQFTKRLSLRTIVRWDTTRVDPARTVLEAGRNWNGDVLLTYLVNPWSAVYVGYNTNRRGIELVDEGAGPIVRPAASGLLQDARQVFVKLSHLWSL